MPPNAAYGPYDAALSMFMHELKKYKKYFFRSNIRKKEHRKTLHFLKRPFTNRFHSFELVSQLKLTSHESRLRCLTLLVSIVTHWTYLLWLLSYE